jgi:prepilin-type N-terminal cleavage/methylation domain-containing protein
VICYEHGTNWRIESPKLYNDKHDFRAEVFKNMKTSYRSRGFSLIELLTVIAIIAILAAIIFPVMGVVKERARQNNCMANLHQIAQGVAMFKTDNRKYPIALTAAVYDMGGNLLPIDAAKRDDHLFSEYVPSAKAFHCPSSEIIDIAAVAKVRQKDYTDDPLIDVYQYNSYEVYVYRDKDGNNVAERHYCPDWAADVDGVDAWTTDGGTSQADYERQLKFRNPPADTVVTWCSYHEKRAGSDVTGNAIAVFLDGSTDLVPAAKMEHSRWRIKPKKG